MLRELDMADTLKKRIEDGMPVLAICAGLILLAQELSNDEKVHLATLPVVVKRNAYGRQLGSFHTEAEFQGLGKIPMTFIRAPYIEKVGKGVEVLAVVDGNIVAVRYHSRIGISFHPELDGNSDIHKMLLDCCHK